MLDRLRRWVSAGPHPGPALHLVHFDGAVLTFRARQRLPLQHTVPLAVTLADGRQETAHLKLLTRETYSRDDLTYTAEVTGSPEVRRRLFELYSVAQKAEGGAPERRADPRLAHKIRIRSRNLPNYQGVTEDVSAGGARLVVDGELRPGDRLDMQVQFDHTRFEDMALNGFVVWCYPRDTRTWWAGVRFDDPKRDARRVLERFQHEITEARLRGLQREHDL